MAADASMKGYIDLLITIDPVSWNKTDGVEGEVTTWINVHATPSTSNGFDGDAWGKKKGATH